MNSRIAFSGTALQYRLTEPKSPKPVIQDISSVFVKGLDPQSFSQGIIMVSDNVSATVPDWERERVRRFYDPSRQLLKHLRGYQRCKSSAAPIRWLISAWHVLWHRFWSVVTGAEIPLNSHIAGGVLLPHPNGVVIYPDAEIGPNCLLFQQVTIGTGGPIPGSPKLGGHVDVGAGAKILGGVVIGDHARIGANAVVLQDVPSHATAVGIPARIVSPNDRARPEAFQSDPLQDAR